MDLRHFLVAAAVLLASWSTVSEAGGGGSVHVHGYTTRSGHYVAPYTRSAPHSGTHAPSLHSHPSTRAAVGVSRDSHGRIKRSETAKRDFEHHHPCPSTGKTSGACPRYVVDHVVPLKRGGADAPTNRQWQTKDAAKEKDRGEKRRKRPQSPEPMAP